jgi:hypothetical protein
MEENSTNAVFPGSMNNRVAKSRLLNVFNLDFYLENEDEVS